MTATITSDASFVEMANAREPEQMAVMKKIIAEGHCPFCQEHFQKYHQSPILHDGEYWFVTPNAWPYKHVKHHFLVIGKPHWEKMADVPPEAGAELIEQIQWIEKEYDFPGGGLGWRFGDLFHSGGTVKHLHLQVIMPDLEDPEYEPVRLKIGVSREKLEELKEKKDAEKRA
jgi:ATP adenylyltransferase